MYYSETIYSQSQILLSLILTIAFNVRQVETPTVIAGQGPIPVLLRRRENAV